MARLLTWLSYERLLNVSGVCFVVFLLATVIDAASANPFAIRLAEWSFGAAAAFVAIARVAFGLGASDR